jgi:hypothetical protein
MASPGLDKLLTSSDNIMTSIRMMTLKKIIDVDKLFSFLEVGITW